MGKAKKVKKAAKSKPRVAGPAAKSGGGGLVKSAISAGSSLLGGGSSRGGGGGRRRRRGPEYWAKKVLVEKLKKRYWRVKYGGSR